jgi:hypothetical protein
MSEINIKSENALSFNDIKDMSQDELDNLISVCYHESKLRCWDKGVFNLKSTEIKSNSFIVNWEDSEGDNEVRVYSLDDKIEVNSDEWSYGIYKC